MNRETDAIGLMADFAGRTGIGTDAPLPRYLWTDAYAVRNFARLFAATGDPRYRTGAADLIDAVHGVLGRHRPDDPREGWLSGLAEEEGRRHPTRGGLRIGKPLPERGRDEPADDRLEWDRDGQYFHYLTRWVDALTYAAVALDESLYRRHASELAAAILPPFLRRNRSGSPIGITWKMSIDLSRPLVSGANPHDALDGYATFRCIGGKGALAEEIRLLGGLIEDQGWGTSDPLGLGGLLVDAVRLTELTDRTPAEERMMGAILSGADAGLRQYLAGDPLAAPAARRLGFRELGLAIGLQGLPWLDAHVPNLDRGGRAALTALLDRAGAGEEIVSFWADPGYRQVVTWQDHRDINEVMLATALIGAPV